MIMGNGSKEHVVNNMCLNVVMQMIDQRTETSINGPKRTFPKESQHEYLREIKNEEFLLESPSSFIIKSPFRIGVLK